MPGVPTRRRTHGDSGGLQISCRGFAAHTGGLLDAPQRPAQPSQCDDLLFLFFAQDIAHVDGAYSLAGINVLNVYLSLAGFQVTIIGRFWVTRRGKSASHCDYLTPNDASMQVTAQHGGPYVIARLETMDRLKDPRTPLHNARKAAVARLSDVP